MKVIMASPEYTREIMVEWLECTSTDGSYLIMPGHAPCVLLLAPAHPLSMKLRQGAIKSLTVIGGVISVARDKVIVLLEDSA